MRKIILNLAVSLDGYIEGPKGEYDWCMVDQDYGMTEFLNNTDAILFGRKSYDLLMSYDANSYPDKMKYVISGSLTLQKPNTVVISEQIEEEVQRIKNQEGKNIWLYGGASLTTALVNAGLVDELMLSVHPILLGNGKLLFQDIRPGVQLELKGSVKYSSGLIQLIYRINH